MVTTTVDAVRMMPPRCCAHRWTSAVNRVALPTIGSDDRVEVGPYLIRHQ